VPLSASVVRSLPSGVKKMPRRFDGGLAVEVLADGEWAGEVGRDDVPVGDAKRDHEMVSSE
jgi:hypothetical protein